MSEPIGDEALAPLIHDERTVWQGHRRYDLVDCNGHLLLALSWSPCIAPRSRRRGRAP